MAIAFSRARPIPITEKAGVTREFAYIGRTVMTDPRHEVPFDYSHLHDDLVHVEVLLPANVPEEFRKPAVLAHALDMAEIRKIRTPLSERIRKPQGVMSVIIALPPETEVSLDEAITIARRIARSPCGSHPVPIHIAIHNALVNRHAHAAIGFRPMAPDGTFGLKIPELFARFSVYGTKAKVSEGTDWPDLSFEIQATLFVERGIDLVVDPCAPVPEEHLDVDFHDEDTRRRVNIQREAMRNANVSAIKASPTHLLEALLRGRSSLQVAELHRLCARFIDNEGDRRAEVDRILTDQNVASLAEATEAQKPRYVTTRRVGRLIERATKLIDRAGTELIAITGPDHGPVVAQLADLYAAGHQGEPPLILGRSLSDCGAIADALAEHCPIVGTLDMAITGDSDQRKEGRKKGVCMKPERTVIVPHAELIDDRRLARLLIAADRIGSKLLFGHDQSRETGIVCRHLAAYIADRPLAEPVLARAAVERLLRCGLVRHAIEAMADLGLLHFGSAPDCYIDDTLPFAVVDDPRHVEGIGNTIRMDRVLAGLLDKHQTLAGPRADVELSLGEWIVTTGRRGLPETLGAHQLAQIVAIDPADNWIDVVRFGSVARLDFKNDPAIRPAAAIAIRDAWDAPPDANLVIELTDPRRVWSALLLAANRIGNAQICIDRAIARNLADLVDAARRSLPADLPPHRVIRPDYEAMIGQIIGQYDRIPEPAAAPPEQTPPPIGFAKDVRHALMKNDRAKRVYRLLHEQVSRQNPDRAQNVQRLLGLCSSELTKAIILFLAEEDAGRELDDTDLPFEMIELEPRHWTPQEKADFEMDLNLMTVRASGWGLLPPIVSQRHPAPAPPEADPTNTI